MTTMYVFDDKIFEDDDCDADADDDDDDGNIDD